LDCIIIIPLYKSFNDLSTMEVASLQQSLSILHKYDFCFIGDEILDYRPYQQMAGKFGVKIKIQTFKATFFENVEGYNTLLKNLNFYKVFKDFDYMLICQLDAWVFRDELDYWCRKDYDYIGAPWFKGWIKPDSMNQIIGVGNGGFSLRNIKKTFYILRKISILKKVSNFWYFTKLQGILKIEKILFLFKKILQIKDIKNFSKAIYLIVNEDIYLSQIIPSCFGDYRIAPPEEAMKFSFEVNAAYLFKKNNNKLPFGCHAWQKYESEFWKAFIPTSDQKVNIQVELLK
jgi:hypothetical protein